MNIVSDENMYAQNRPWAFEFIRFTFEARIYSGWFCNKVKIECDSPYLGVPLPSMWVN